MPLYPYKCDSCSHAEDLLRRMIDAPPWVTICPSCGFETFRRDMEAGAPAVSAFSPYVEDNFDGTPVEVTSSKQRDALCEQHGMTYDRVSNLKKADPDVDVGLDEKMVESILEETQGGKILPKDVQEACKTPGSDD